MKAQAQTSKQAYIELKNEGFPKLDEEYYVVSQVSYLGERKMQHTGYFYMNGKWRLSF